MATNVYVDGFNLYYGSVKHTPYRWLNIGELFRLLLPSDKIARIHYFTARVKAVPWNPDQANRQRLFLRALQTLPHVQIHYGHFLSHRVKMPLADGSGFAEVLRAEEKGSDVNLATLLVHDAHRGAFDVAAVVTNDSDLLMPISIVRQELSLPVGVICPHKYPNPQLKAAASFFKLVREWALKASQFPDVLTDAKGTFHKPPVW